MAKVDIRTNITTHYDAQRMDVVKGVELDASLVEYEGEVEWIDHNDPILEIVPSGHNAHITAKEIGVGRITIAKKSDGDAIEVVKVLRLHVVDKIELPASSLGVSAEIVEKQNL